ncbi:MAG: hypothetical protein QOI73_2228 [Solirubrobacteraceae bacterium]|nr:hypothetical protein [Solirubrobacteraceae bacterium]
MSPTTAAPAYGTEEKALCHLINAYRQQHGRAPLKVGVALSRAATWMSNDMAHNDNFDHTDTHGREAEERLKAFGYGGPTSGENIAGGSATAAETMQQWKNSPPHRANLLRTKFKAVGIARSHDADSMLGWYWTADFGGSVGKTMTL